MRGASESSWERSGDFNYTKGWGSVGLGVFWGHIQNFLNKDKTHFQEHLIMEITIGALIALILQTTKETQVSFFLL